MDGVWFVVAACLSKESLRFRYTFEQGYDASCGMSVVATALDRYWGVRVSEDELLASMVGAVSGDGAYTVSLADMARAFEAHGVATRAFRLDWDGLVGLVVKGYAPIVVHYDRPEDHFALLLGFRDGWAIVADPSRGLESLSRAEFERRYSGAAMALASRDRPRDEALVAAAVSKAAGTRAMLETVARGVGRTR